MSYIVPFQKISLFEATFQQQINKKTGNIEERKFVFNQHFGDGENDLPVEPDRYRLIWMAGCPHSNKAVIALRLLGLDRVISIGECGVLRDPRGWVFSEDIGEVDPVLKIHYLDDAYLRGNPDFTGRSTVPAIVDERTGAVVQNEAWDIPKYLVIDWKKYHKKNAPDLYPETLRSEIDEISQFVKHDVNAYACGFARKQETFDKGYKMFFDALDVLEARLSGQRYLNGDYITLSDLHLYVALIRFHLNYHLVFGVNKKRLEDYPNLWGYVRDIYQTEGFYEYTKLEWIKKHYQLSPHMRAKCGNVYGLIGTGPDNRSLLEPTGREKLSSHPMEKFLYEKEERNIFKYENEETVIKYLNDYLLYPIKKAGMATYQNELERWAHNEEDTLKDIDKHLTDNTYLLGEKMTNADVLLYQTLLRHDYIYYYLYKLNFAKSSDFPNIKKYLRNLQQISEIRNSIDIEKEKCENYLNLDDDRNPYHLVFDGPED